MNPGPKTEGGPSGRVPPAAVSQPPTGPPTVGGIARMAPIDSGMISGVGPAGAGGTSPPTLADVTMLAMHGEEAARSASFGRVVAILCAVGLAFLMLDDKTRPLRTVMATSQAVLGSVATWVWWRSRDPRRYSRFVFRIFGTTASLAAVAFMHYLGVFSPVTTVVILGIAFFGQADDVRALFPIAIFVILAYLVSASLVAFGIIPDMGTFVPMPLPLPQRLAMMVMVAAVMTMQLIQARLSRRAQLEAIARSNEAVRVIRTREAQLDEARDNLDAAIRAGAGRSGRFTGAMVGRFRLEEIIGRGAMGEIYAASIEAGGRAAVKLLQLARKDDPEIVRRFLIEAEIATRVRGPNLVEVFEAGTAPDGSLFIAMELLVGTDLAALLRERTMLPVREVVTLIEDVAHGLEVLHKASVVHRDLKPQNLFLTLGPPPCWKILDYGVSKVVDGSATLTMGQLIGTPGYMSPEQAEGKGEIDARSDVFALGAVAYRALTGRRPFVGPDTPQILFQVVYGMPIRPREVAPHLERDVELVLGLALAKKPSHRFPTAKAFATALRMATSGALDPNLRAAAERLQRSLPWSHDPIAMSRAARGGEPNA